MANPSPDDAPSLPKESHPRVEVLGNIGPNWFASVMGTGIVAIAGATLPVHVPGLRGFTSGVWVLAAALLAVLIVLVGGHWLRNPTVARTHARNPQMAHFYGAAPMALMTVGAGAVLVGGDLIGRRVAVDLDWVLWTAGTAGGLFTAVSIPFLMFTQLHVEPDAAFGGWLMPVVPPMVSAATGALLLPHMPPGTGRETMLYGCYAMFGLSLIASLNIIAMIWSRLVLYGTSGSARVPTLWIVLGPLGQSITAAGLLATAAATGAVDHQLAAAMHDFAVIFGVPVWGFAVLWISLATALTVRTLRRGMPFALTWWSLTFPVGTFVTGTSQLAAHTHLPAFKVAAAVAYLGLLLTWILVTVRTARGSLRGNLLTLPPSSAPVKAHKEDPIVRTRPV
ncbi:C4-dicarboxylate ABC transporter [Mycobacterium paragordonae]|uniref:C4-dicarboxylate ABC transporter n=1 Tax=Mycobacterium paragordonae TaxID=1389713 RepID=A0ABQ1CBF6_9MYCO|nr:TDT family transporter [Mycobacterium paragordonae]AYE97929.1 C4-dicarboxylate ABC transporter [Mycobacterium paragordonae]GFG81682.1 C4-dicarboxylate ABC transporter [Mycobacterium paragordonae]